MWEEEPAWSCMLCNVPLYMQALSLGLGGEWQRVKEAYAAANRALGDIVKVMHTGCNI